METFRRDLREIIDLEGMRVIQKGFAKMIEASLLTLDSDGRPIGELDSNVDACRMIHEITGGMESCRRENDGLAAGSLHESKPFRGLCRFGLMKIAFPLSLGKRKNIGILMACGLKPCFEDKAGELRWEEDTVGKARNFGVDGGKYKLALARCKGADEEYIDQVINVLKNMGSIISDLGYFGLLKNRRTKMDDRDRMDEIAKNREEVRELKGRLDKEENIERSIIENISDGILVMDAENRIRVMNPAAENYLNTSREVVIGKEACEGLEEILRNIDVENAGQWRSLALGDEGDTAGESICLLRISGPIQRVLKRLSISLETDSQTNSGRLVVLHDITSHQRAEDLKENLISMVSHELRTPLTSIKGALNIIRDNPKGRIQELIQIASRNCDRLSRLVENILDVTRLRIGKMGFALARYDLSDIVEKAGEQVYGLAGRSGVGLEVEIPISTYYVMVDRLRIEQAVINLIHNAVKHSPRRTSVFISAELAWKDALPEDRRVGGAMLFEENGDKERTPCVRLSIKDQGPGIMPEDMDRIFKPFYQSDMGLTRKSGGLGLGLTLSRAIIEEHGGKLWCENIEGGGCRFIAELPCETMPVSEESPVSGSGRLIEDRRRHILVVDDDPDLVEVLSAALERYGYTPLKAYSGREALSITEKTAPCAIILDVFMPDMDGYEVLMKLKESSINSEIPVIMITAGEPEGRAKAIDLGAVAYLTKPFDELVIMEMLHQFRNGR